MTRKLSIFPQDDNQNDRNMTIKNKYYIAELKLKQYATACDGFMTDLQAAECCIVVPTHEVVLLVMY